MSRLLIYLFLLACAIWVIYNVWSKRRNYSDTEKLIWTIAAIAFSFITAVVFFFTQQRRNR